MAFDRSLARAISVAAFLYIAFVLCPIRFWALDYDFDNTWVFAANYAAAHGLANGRDLFWNTGPLGYLAFPQDIGNNLFHALVFQLVIWGVLLMAVVDVFFIARFPLRNIAIFAVFLGLSAPLYWFNYMGLENLLLVGALLFLIAYRWRGGRIRYAAALVLIGMIPLIKLTGAMLAAAALAGFLIDRALDQRLKVAVEGVWSAVIPAAVAMGTAILLSWPFDAAKYLKASLEIVRGYSFAMSLPGPKLELLACFVTLALIGALLWWQRGTSPEAARFSFLLLIIPLVISVKHGFVRQDFHTVNFFCFAALALGLIFLSAPLQGGRAGTPLLAMAIFGVIWSYTLVPDRVGVRNALVMATGLRSAAFAAKAAGGIDAVRNHLRGLSEECYLKTRIERDLRAAIGDSEVASLSIVYSWAAMDGLRLKLYPIVQRHTAYTPYLDRLNADWIRDQGPRFLISDGQTIDQRNVFAETPATWLEVYRWYDLHSLGSRNLLLERRAQPRFESLQSVARQQGELSGDLPIPVAHQPVLLSMKCDLSLAGKLGSLLLRVPEVRLVTYRGKQVDTSRIIPDVFIAPAVVNSGTRGLADVAWLFRNGGPTSNAKPIEKLTFTGPGLSYYSKCEFELHRRTMALAD